MLLKSCFYSNQKIHIYLKFFSTYKITVSFQLDRNRDNFITSKREEQLYMSDSMLVGAKNANMCTVFVSN